VSEFVVKITHRRYRAGERTEIYHLHEDAHDSTAAFAAQEAIAAWANHGHGKFPYNNGPLLIEVDEVPDGR
jgi:hypothetical protein